jgi:glycogen synthase
MFGTPVTICVAGGAPEVVTYCMTGVLAKPGDTNSLTAALEALLSNATLRRAMGIATRSDYKARFTEANMHDDFLKIIDLISTPASPERR